LIGSGSWFRQGERETQLQYLRTYRRTLELKCAGLDAEQLARRSVPPSTMSLGAVAASGSRPAWRR
jgi:hypothetical protein